MPLTRLFNDLSGDDGFAQSNFVGKQDAILSGFKKVYDIGASGGLESFRVVCFLIHGIEYAAMLERLAIGNYNVNWTFRLIF